MIVINYKENQKEESGRGSEVKIRFGVSKLPGLNPHTQQQIQTIYTSITQIKRNLNDNI